MSGFLSKSCHLKATTIHSSTGQTAIGPGGWRRVARSANTADAAIVDARIVAESAKQQPVIPALSNGVAGAFRWREGSRIETAPRGPKCSRARTTTESRSRIGWAFAHFDALWGLKSSHALFPRVNEQLKIQLRPDTMLFAIMWLGSRASHTGRHRKCVQPKRNMIANRED